MVPPSLTRDKIHAAIDEVCDLLNDAMGSQQVWKLRRATTPDFAAKSGAVVVDQTLLFGIVSSPIDNEDGCSDILTTLYFAYSTWDGRYLYLDEPGIPGSKETCSGLNLLLRRALADIAIRLHCDRFTWQHYGSESSSAKYTGNIQPETLHGWLTLHWHAETIEGFLKRHDGLELKPRDTSGRPLTDEMIRETFSMCLTEQSHAELNLKLATVEDLDSIGRLVQGLADFEKEPDAVNVSVELYRRDGFEERPCFHCIMLNGVGKDDKMYAFGMAFCYVGFTLSDGLFLYLEDLYIEEAYRGKGAGSTVMKALASISYSLGCSRVVWQALDWNTPALTFYGKLGAKVQEGLLTTRFAGNALKTFVGEAAGNVNYM